MTKLFTAVHAIQTNAADRRTLDGREYLVVPGVAIREGVLNGYLIQSDEIGIYTEAWNGRPFTLRHPEQDGQYISANSPQIIESVGIGHLFGARMDGDRLRCDLWLDVAKAQAVGGDALAVLQRFEAGEPVELSTGYFCDIEETSGEWQGKRYVGIQRNLRPDHIAALPNEIGACSWRDGCGAPRVNMDTNITSNCGCNHPATNAQHDGVMLAFYLRSEDAQALALSNASESVEALPASELHVTLAYLGKTDEQWLSQADLFELAADFARYRVAVAAQVRGGGKLLNTDDGQDAHFAIVQSEQLYQFREQLCEWLQYEVPVERRHSYLPHITLAYGPAGTDVALSISERDLVFDALAVSWGDLTVTFPLQGQIRETEMATNELEQAKVTPKANAGQPAKQPGEQVETPAVNTAQPVAQPLTNAAQKAAVVLTQELGADIQAVAAAIKELGGVNAVKSALQAIQVNASRMKSDLVARIVANRNCAFTADELSSFSLEQLEKMERTLRPADYSGRSGMAANVFGADDSEWEEYTPPTLEAAADK